jgi:hypothetical protein
MSEKDPAKVRGGRARAAQRWAAATAEERVAATAAARAAANARFERQVDPDGVLDPAERARRAAHAAQAHYLRMSIAAKKVHQAKRDARARAERAARKPAQ